MTSPAEALWLGSEDCPLMGWYHPAQQRPRDCGVVLCAPFGHEYLVSYRAHRKLAEALSAAGFPVLFFDYDGTGDSADSAQPRVQAWHDNIAQAMQSLQTRSGCRQFALFGVRLGALLAATTHASEKIAALLMVAPVISGRGYARELVAFARMSPIPPSDDPDCAVNDDEIAGYPISKDTQAALGKLNLLKTALPSDCKVFISTTDDITGREDKLIEALQNTGLEVTVSAHGGYAAMMSSDAYNSCVPDALWAELVGWMEAHFRPVSTVSPPALASLDRPRLAHWQDAEGQQVKEELVSFGGGLVGMFNHPTRAHVQGMGVILSNTGSGHRVGNHRLNVQLARCLAAQGFHVLRFDRAGLGYSRATPEGTENEVYSASGIQDIRQAMDFVQQAMAQKGATPTTFILAGLCSGAYFSYRTAVADTRVRGLIMINPLTFNWHDGDSLEVRSGKHFKSTGFYLRNVWNPSTWRRLFQGDIALRRIVAMMVNRGLIRLRHALVSRLGSLAKGLTPEKSVARDFLQLAARGVDLMFVFGADDAAIDVTSAELGPNAQILKDYPKLRIEVVSHTDHTFTPRWSQRYLRTLLAAQLSGYHNG